jgi:hypothetical protein
MTTRHRFFGCAGIFGPLVIGACAMGIEACASAPAADGSASASPVEAGSNPTDGPPGSAPDAGTSPPQNGDDASLPVGGGDGGAATKEGGATSDGGKGHGGANDGGNDAGSDAGDDVGPFAYAISVNPNGTWVGIEDPATEIAEIIASGAKYVRFAMPASGTPTVTDKTYLDQLIQAGVHPGAVIVTQNGAAVSDLIATGAALEQTGLYHWLFVDGALTRTDIQQIIDGLTQAGWDKIMVNDTLFGTPNQVADPPSGVWGHAKLFDGIDPSGPAITPHDDAFIQYIHQHFPQSIALLKLEIDSEVEKFKALPTATQIQLLTSWSQAQSSHGFTMIYPLFTTTYDSEAAGTYGTMVNLMK